MKLDEMVMSLDLTQAGEVARRSEERGFAGLWTGEAQHDPFIPLALAGAETERVTLGTSIALAFVRSPMVTALTAWDLQKLSKGRFVLGLGTQVKGHNEHRYSVKWEHPAPKMREVVQSIRAIWDTWQNGTPLKFRGEFYRFDLMTPFFSPGPIDHPRIPVYMAGVGPMMCRVAGEVADGLHIHPLTSPKFLREHVRPAIQAGLDASGRSMADFGFTLPVLVVLGDTPEERAGAREAVRKQISFYASTRTYQVVMETHGWGDVTTQLSRMSIRGEWAAMAGLITDEMVDTFAVEGTYASIADAIRSRYEGLADRVSLYAPHRMERLSLADFEDPRLDTVIRAFNG